MHHRTHDNRGWQDSRSDRSSGMQARNDFGQYNTAGYEAEYGDHRSSRSTGWNSDRRDWTGGYGSSRGGYSGGGNDRWYGSADEDAGRGSRDWSYQNNRESRPGSFGGAWNAQNDDQGRYGGARSGQWSGYGGSRGYDSSDDRGSRAGSSGEYDRGRSYESGGNSYGNQYGSQYGGGNRGGSGFSSGYENPRSYTDDSRGNYGGSGGTFGASRDSYGASYNGASRGRGDQYDSRYGGGNDHDESLGSRGRGRYDYGYSNETGGARAGMSTYDTDQALRRGDDFYGSGRSSNEDMNDRRWRSGNQDWENRSEERGYDPYGSGRSRQSSSRGW